MKQFLRHIFLLLALFMATTNAWALRYAKAIAKSSPTQGGWVWVTKTDGNAPSTWDRTEDSSENDNGKISNYTFPFYYYAKPQAGYEFKGWATASNTNTLSSTVQTNWYVGVTATSSNNVSWNPATATYYAIFAKLTTNVSSLSFEKNVDEGWGAENSLVATYVHAGDVTAKISGEHASDFSFSNSSLINQKTIASNNTDVESSQTIYIYINPSSSGNRTATLTISGNGMTKTVVLNGKGIKLDQTLSWNNESAIETNMQLGKMQTVTATATSGLAVTYSSSDNSVLTVDANGKITAVGIGNATITASQAGNYKYNAAPSITKTYTVWNKNTPIFTPNGFNEANVCHLKVGDKVTLEVLNVSDGLSGDFKVNTDNNILGITRNGNTITIEALNAGTADAIFTQTENNDIFGAEKKYQFSVSKINNSLAIASSSYTKYVDDEITNIISSVNSDATVTTISSDATIAYYDVTNNKIVIPNSEAKSFSSKTITITIAQAETYKYTAAEKTITLTVNKYTPTFTWNAGNATYYYLSTIANIFDTSNDDFGYTVVSNNEQVAKVIDNTLHIYNVEETANITVTQAENYKWNGKTETYTITPANPNNHVTFTYTQAMFNDGSITTQKVAGTSCSWSDGIKLESKATDWDDKYVVIHFEGIPKDISFKYKASDSNVSNGVNNYRQADWYIAESADGKEWSSCPWENLGGDKSNSTSWVTVSNKPLNSTTRYLKLCYSGNFAGYYSDIVVTELEKFEAAPNPLDFGTQGVKYGEQVLPLNFSHANAGRITIDTIIGNDAKYFTVTPTVIPGTGRDMSGTAHLNVAFDNKGEDRGLTTPYEATLVITDNAGNREEVTLTGIRHGKSTPVFTWNPNHLPYYFGSSIANIVVSSNTDYTKCPLTITSSNETIAKVENGRLYIYETDGEVTFTVTQRGNDDYNEHTEKFTFTPSKRPELTVPFRATEELYKKAAVSVYWSNWDGANNEIRLGEDCSIFQEGAWDWEKKTVLFVFDGVPDKVSFQYRASNGTATAAQWNVEQSADGVNWESIWSKESSSTSWNTIEKELLPNTRYLRFSYSGNFAGYYKNIAVSELVGYKYLRTADGHYLSRGAKYGTQAVVDAFGVVSRISRYTEDNENIYTRFFFVDNEQYMFETETKDAQRLHEVFTDDDTADNTNNLWQINNNGGILTIQSANEVGVVSHKGNYITAVNGVLAFTTNEAEATKWQMEDYTEHPQYIADILNRQAAAAALKDFGEDINTLEKVRNRLKVEDFETREITIQPLELGEQTGENRTVEGMPHIYEQTITVDPGFYRLTVKALYRISNSEIAWKCNQEKGKESVLAYAYANDVQYPIQSVYASYHSSAIENTDELRDGKYYSTTLSSAAIAFNDVNRYLNDVYVYVEADPGQTTGTLRYGIKCPSYVPGAWLAYSTVTLTHFGRKEYIFEGKDPQNHTDWNTPENWNRGEVPNQYHNVRISADAVISTPVNVYELIIEDGNTVHITSSGGLTIGNGGVREAQDKCITIDNFPEGAGFLRVAPGATKQMINKVKVNYATKAYNSGNPRDEVWQYVGAPGEGMQMSNMDKTLIYHWNEQEGWVKNSGTSLEPFVGYALTQNQAQRGEFEILATPIFENKKINLTLTPKGMNGDNLFVNSYLSPIDVARIDPNTDYKDIEGTFYLFNSGSWKNWQADGGADQVLTGDSPGKYFAITPGSAALIDSNKDQTTIPPMQGAYVIAKTNDAWINLDYRKHVYDVTSSMNRPMRAPQIEDENFMRVRMQVNSQNSGADRMYVIQHENTTRGYDDGYDAKNILADGQANIYTNEAEGQMEISVADQIDSTFIGFTAGEDSVYTLTFTSLVGKDMYLHDLVADSLFLLVEDGQYSFSAQPNSVNDLRFQLILYPELSDDNLGDNVTTGMEDVLSSARIWVNDKQIYITNALQNSTLDIYTVSGMCITSSLTIHDAPCTIDLSHLPTGVYVLRLNNQAYKFVCK